MTHASITTADVRYVAALSKIAVTDEEAAKLQGELAVILDYVQQLNDLDTSGVEPTYQVNGLTNIDRDDTIIDYGVDQQALLGLAPQSQDNQIKVPKVL